MPRRQFALAGLSVATLAALGQTATAGAAAQDHHTHLGYSEAFKTCAEACSRCQRECSRCAIHCANHLAQESHHHQTLRLCLDCADFCQTAAQIVSRGGPMAMLICKPCAEACKLCGDACREHAEHDERMRQCADECKRCEDACRAMLRTAAKEAAPAR
jgi:hypothetical protein